MNLVAKEYVAAQDPENPGVLVLSEFAGAANELDAALQVNPNDIDGIADQLAVALKMPREERVERWQSMMKKLRETSLDGWFSSFIASLQRGVPDEPAARMHLPVPANQPQKHPAVAMGV
jgi:trehalose 6-phosphate synthase